MNSSRLCTNCNKVFPTTTEYFHRNKTGKYGLSSICKKCAIARAKIWQTQNKSRVYDKNMNWRISNPDVYRNACRVGSAKFRELNPESVKESQEKWKDANPNYYKDWAIANPEKVKTKNEKHRGLGNIFLFNNPFPKNVPVVGHHISDGFKVYIPESLHLEHYTCHNTEKHRKELKFYVEEIYNISYLIEES